MVDGHLGHVCFGYGVGIGSPCLLGVEPVHELIDSWKSGATLNKLLEVVASA